MQKSITSPINILLLENISKNIDLVKQMLDATKFQYMLHVSNSVKETIHCLNKEGIHKNKLKPDIIFLNSDPALKYRKKILREIKNNESHKATPVLLLKISELRKIISGFSLFL